MTNPDRRTAFALRLEGKSWEEIGQALGYCGSTVYADLTACIRQTPRQPNICYPALRAYVAEHCEGSVLRFSAACGVRVNTLYPLFSGKTAPRQPVIDAILRATGLPYEEAFRKEG